jgi:hypothetical protein
LTVVADPAMRCEAVAIARQSTLARFGRHGAIEGLVASGVRRARSRSPRHEHSDVSRGVRSQGHRPDSVGTPSSADPRAHGGPRALQGKEVARLLGQCWPMPDGARGAARERFPQPNGPINAKKRGADAKPAMRPHRLAVACNRLIRTTVIPNDGAPRAAAGVVGAQRVRGGAAVDCL